MKFLVFSPRVTSVYCICYYLFLRIDDRIHSSLTAVRCFDNGYVGKQPAAWKKNYGEYWLKEFQESMDSCIILVTEILLKMALSNIQSICEKRAKCKKRINQSFEAGKCWNFYYLLIICMPNGQFTSWCSQLLYKMEFCKSHNWVTSFLV